MSDFLKNEQETPAVLTTRTKMEAVMRIRAEAIETGMILEEGRVEQASPVGTSHRVILLSGQEPKVVVNAYGGYTITIINYLVHLTAHRSPPQLQLEQTNLQNLYHAWGFILSQIGDPTIDLIGELASLGIKAVWVRGDETRQYDTPQRHYWQELVALFEDKVNLLYPCRTS